MKNYGQFCKITHLLPKKPICNSMFPKVRRGRGLWEFEYLWGQLEYIIIVQTLVDYYSINGEGERLMKRKEREDANNTRWRVGVIQVGH